MPFRFHDTLTGEIVELDTVEPGVVRMYNCGPTVYDTPHIGNFRAWTCADVMRRALELGGYDVRQIMNITDVGHLTLDDIESGEDKLQAAARRKGLDAWEVAKRYTDEFFDMARRLNLTPAQEYPRATDHIAEMIEMIQGLIERGHAYVTPSGNVYFDVSTFPRYGRLSNNSVDDLVAGSRVAVVDEKRHPADFALWKRDPNHQMKWASPWGEGFPGWHVECSAMARKYLGDELDIHSGGEDNIFPHHECEIAQSEGFTGKPFARIWLHNRHLLVDGRKMAKSAGTMYTVTDVLERGVSMRALRLALLSTHYRLPMNFTWESLEAAERTIAGLDTSVRGMEASPDVADDPALGPACDDIEARFLAALQDDLNVSAALAVVHELKSFVNRTGLVSVADAERLRAAWARLDSVLGLSLLETAAAEPEAGDDDDEIQRLVDERTAARDARDWARADELRDELTARGIKIEDSADGVRWTRG